MESPMTRIQWTAALVVLTLLPAAAMAQSPKERLDAAISHSQEAGIPVSLLQSKIAEGRAQGGPMDRMATAVENLLRNVVQARNGVSPGPGCADAAQLPGADGAT